MEITSTIYPSLKNRRVFITGGATGIGAEMARAFAQQGCDVAFIDLNRAKGQLLATELEQSFGVKVFFKVIDITDLVQLQLAIDEAVDSLGGIDCLVNNAANDMRQSVEKVTPIDWQKSLSINLDPVFFAAQYAVSYMKERGAGAIINFSSLNALFGAKNLTAYSTAKAGIIGLTKSLAQEFGPDNIRVNAVIPGWVATEKQLSSWLTQEEEEKWMAGMAIKKRIEPTDIAKLVLFLASDDSAMITGQAMQIDGGKLL